VDVDSIVETQLEESDREAVFPGARLAQITADSPFSILHFRAVLEAPLGPELRFDTRSFPELKRSVSKQAGMQQIILDGSNIFPRPGDVLPAPETPSLPTVTFTNVGSWQALAQWYGTVIPRASGQTANSGPPAAGRLSALEDAFEEMRNKVHDSGIGLGLSPYTLRSPAETLKKGVGDSKDEAVLLISKFAELGITAKAALISQASQPEVIPELPGIEAFNHVLIYVPGEHPLWIDPGAEFTPVSRLPALDQGRWALLIDPESKDLLRTPESSAAENRQVQTSHIRLRDDSDPQVTFTVESRGAFEDSLRPALDALVCGDKEQQERVKAQFL
jgi:hypothetical protein